MSWNALQLDNVIKVLRTLASESARKTLMALSVRMRIASNSWCVSDENPRCDFDPAVLALRLVYDVTLLRDCPVAYIAYAKRSRKVSFVLARDQVRRRLACVS